MPFLALLSAQHPPQTQSPVRPLPLGLDQATDDVSVDVEKEKADRKHPVRPIVVDVSSGSNPGRTGYGKVVHVPHGGLGLGLGDLSAETKLSAPDGVVLETGNRVENRNLNVGGGRGGGGGENEVSELAYLISAGCGEFGLVGPDL